MGCFLVGRIYTKRILIKMSTSHVSPYPLPRAPQHAYTKWYNHTIPSGTFAKHTIVWVGTALECRFRSETIGNVIGPHNVFILKKNSTFVYAIMDNTDTLFKFPKKFYTACFPGIQFHSIPPDNKMTVQITKDSSIELPYIPQAFLQQKRIKGTRLKRKRSHSTEMSSSIETIDFTQIHPTWHILGNDQVKENPFKAEIMLLMRSIMDHAVDSHTNYLKDPFSDIFNVEDIFKDQGKTKTLKTIVGFLFHYCRSEMGCNRVPHSNSTFLEKWIAKVNSGGIE